MVINKISDSIFALLTVLVLDITIQPAYSITSRDVVIVSEKKYISPGYIEGLDTYDRPFSYYRKEEYILRFKDRNGYFNVNKELFNSTWLGRKFTTEKDVLYFCIPNIDGCDSFK